MIIMMVEKNGQTYEFNLSIGKILEMEAADPQYSFIEDVQSLASRPRLLTLDKLMRASGQSLEGLISAGFAIDEISEIFAKVLDSAGFFKSSGQED